MEKGEVDRKRKQRHSGAPGSEMATVESAEIQSLERIHWRLVNTSDEDGDLERVLSKLVPIMVKKMDWSCGMDPREGRRVQQKVLEILSHVNTRLAGSHDIRLPVEAIWEAYCSCDTAVARNIGMVYLGKAIDRSLQDDLWKMVGKFVPGIHGRLEAHRPMLAMYACRSVNGLHGKTMIDALGMEPPRIFEDVRDVDVFLGYATRLALYVREGTTVRQTPAGTRPRVVAGLSDVDLKLIESSKAAESVEDIVKGALWLVQQAQIEPKKAVMFLLAAASSPYEDVSNIGERLLMKTCVFDTARPTVNVEDANVIKPLFDMYLGTMEDPMIPEAQRRHPASKALRSRIIGILCKSTLACNMNPESIIVIHDCVFGDFAGMYTQQQGMQFAVHVLRHADSLQEIAPSIIRRCLRVLENSPEISNGNINSLRGFAYQCLGQLAQRDPNMLREHRMDLMKTCFEALRIEPPGVRASVQETLNCLANCFKSQSTHEEEIQIRKLLAQYAKSENGSVRQTALQWIIWIFDFSDSFARYHCIVMTSDCSMNVYSLALEGLDVDKVSSFQRAKFHHIVTVDMNMPSLEDMLQTVLGEHPALLNRSHNDLILPPKSMESMVLFLKGLPMKNQSPDVLANFFGTNYAYDLAITMLLTLDIHFVGLLSSCLIKNAPGSLHSIALDTLLQLSSMYSDPFLAYFASKFQLFESMLQHVDEVVSSSAARLLGFVSQSLSEEISYSLTSRIQGVLRDLLQKTKKMEDVLGYLYASSFIEAWKQESERACDSIGALFNIATQSDSKDDIIQSTALLCVGYSTFGRPLEDRYVSIILEDIVPRLKKSTHKSTATRVIDALGLIAMNSKDKTHETAITDEVLRHHCSKDEELLDHCGKALVCIWGGSDTTREQYLLLHTRPGDETPFPGKGTKENREKILKFIVNTCISSSRTESRMAGAMWLLNLVNRVSGTPEISANIGEIQKAFCLLLGDNNDRTQEIASRGVTASYQFARDDLKKDLLDTLVSILSGSKSTWMRPSHVDEDTQLFEPGALGSLPEQGGNISTYKEICSLATDLGQPDLIYQFMNLAAHQAAADASRGAAYGMASVASIAGDALKPHMKTLIPRLYRSTFDPNPLVRDSMRHIWTVLVDDQREVLHAHLSDILSLLTKDMTRQQWRVRESAALATSDILQGIEWVDLRDMFETVLVSCFRVMDDVKESVVIAGQALARSIMSISIRLTDPESTKSKNSKECFAVLFPVLLNQGMTSNVSNIRAFSINMIAKLIKSAKKDTVQDSMEMIVPPLLEALSGTEDTRLNYLEQHVQRLGMDANKFEEERIRFSQSSPVADTLDICAKYINGSTFCDMSPNLSSFIRKAVGSATKAGTATFIIASVRTVGPDASPVAFALMKVLFEASSLENSTSVRKAYAVAYASLAKYAPPKKVDSVIDSWLELCRQEDATKESMRLIGTLLRSLSVDASDVFLRYANDIAPVAYLLGYVTESSVASIWHQVWDELTTATGSGIRSHVVPVTEIVIQALSSSQWGRKKAAGEGIIYLSEHAGDLLGDQTEKILSALLDALSGRLWEGKEILLKSLSAVMLSINKAETQKIENVETKVIDTILVACQKQKKVYKTEAFLQLAKIVKHVSYIDFYPRIWPVLVDVIQLHAKKLQDISSQLSEGTDNADVASLPDLTIILDCVSSLWINTSEANNIRSRSSIDDTCKCLMPILQYSNKPGDHKAVLQTYRVLVSSSDASYMDKSITEDIVLHIISILSSSKVEDIRLLSINVITKVDIKGLDDSFRRQIVAKLQSAEAAEKSAAVRSRIRETISTLS